jgi:hypothetical protein
MNTPAEPTTRSNSTSTLGRCLAVSVILGAVVFLLLWVTVFSFVTSLLIGAGCCAIIMLASATSEPIETIVGAIATIVFGILAAVAAAVVFSLFGN